MNRTKIWEIGGFLAGAVLIVFGVVAIVLGVSGYRTVHNELNQQYIVGSGDMTPAAIQQEAKSAEWYVGLTKDVTSFKKGESGLWREPNLNHVLRLAQTESRVPHVAGS